MPYWETLPGALVIISSQACAAFVLARVLTFIERRGGYGEE